MEENEARKKNVVHPSTTRRNKFDRPIRPVEPEFYLGNSDQTASCQLDRVPPLKKRSESKCLPRNAYDNAKDSSEKRKKGWKSVQRF